MADRNEELEKLKKLSPYSLPDNPSQSGWTTKQVKAKFYQGLFYLYDLIDGDRSLIENVETTLDNLDLDNFVTEEEAQAIKNDAMPYISETPPDVTKTKIWFDTTPSEDYIDVEDLDEAVEEEPMEEEDYTEPLVFNEFFEPLSFSESNSDELSFDNAEEPLSFGSDEQNLTFEN